MLHFRHPHGRAHNESNTPYSLNVNYSIRVWTTTEIGATLRRLFAAVARVAKRVSVITPRAAPAGEKTTRKNTKMLSRDFRFSVVICSGRNNTGRLRHQKRTRTHDDKRTLHLATLTERLRAERASSNNNDKSISRRNRAPKLRPCETK